MVLVVLVAAGCGREAAVPPFPAEHAPSSYRIVYRVEIPGTAPQIEERWVDRPWRGRTDIKKEDGALISSLVQNEDGFFIYANGTWHLAEVGRRLPPSDIRPLASFRLAESQGRAERARTETIIGRPCVVGRVAAPSGPMRAAEGDSAEDFCVDGTGLVLRHTTYIDGVLDRVATAVRLELERGIAEAMFRPPLGDPLPSDGMPPAQVVQLDDFTVPLWRLPESAGFSLDGALATSDEGAAALILSYSQGHDGIEVEQAIGATRPPWDPAEGSEVPTLRWTEVRVERPDAGGAPRFVRVRGAVASGRLQEMARLLSKE